VKKIPKATYKTQEELQDEIRKREIALDLLDEGEVKQTLRIQLAQLRTYAEVKQWAASPAPSDSRPVSPRPTGRARRVAPMVPD
jgi:hypothetical protein